MTANSTFTERLSRIEAGQQIRAEGIVMPERQRPQTRHTAGPVTRALGRVATTLAMVGALGVGVLFAVQQSDLPLLVAEDRASNALERHGDLPGF